MAALTLIILALSFVITTALPVITSSTHSINNGTITALDSTNVRLRCEATGEGTLTYQWRKVSGSLPSSAMVESNNKVLHIRSITIIDGGRYYCEVNDDNDSVSSMRVQVTVKRQPSVSTPSDQQLNIFRVNQQVTLTCRVAGDDITGGYWERVDDEPLPLNNNMSSFSNGKTTLTITIRRVRPTHSGRYRCVVYSQWGVAQSRNVTVTIIIAAPRITKQPTNVIVEVLQDATITCEARGFEENYEWKRHDNSNIIGRQPSLTISRATSLDEDQYYCVAMTEGGYAFSNNVTLTVTGDNFTIVKQPGDVIVSEGGIIVLNVTARGTGRRSFTYEWKKVGSDSLSDYASEGNSTELTITSVKSSDSGLYYCIVTNQWEIMVKSNNATVNVLYIAAHPKDTIVGVGREVTLTCNASGADNLKYQWMRMGNKTIPSTATGVNSSTLVIPSIRVDDSGQYKCVVSSGKVNVMSEYGAVSVLKLTVITMNSNNGDITVAEGNNVTLRCEATVNVTMNYEWSRELESLPEMNVMGRNAQNLTIYNVKVQNGGQYYCHVEIGAEKIRSMSIQVTARRRPSIIDNSDNQSLNIVSGNEQVTLTCEITGDDISGGYWERVNGKPLIEAKNMSSLNDNKTKLQLIINKAHPGNSGMYRCVVYSQWGVAQSRNVQVTITIAPPMITTQPTNQMITALRNVTFTCKAKGFGVKYEWKRHNGRVTGRRRSTLTIFRATPLDEDQYYCVAMTEGGYAFSNNVTLTVNDSIRIRTQPKDIIVSEDGIVVLSIDARGRGLFTYEWKKVGIDSLPDTASGGNSTELTITSVTSSDGGLYYCIVMNQWGTMVKSNNATVNVLYITAHPKDIIVGVGREVTLTCNASGADNLKYQWMRMGNKTIPSTATGVNSNSLVIPSIRVDDSGQYKCVVSSGDVIVMSEYGAVSVLIVTSDPDDVLAVVGTTVTLSCNASGADNLKYQWTKMGNEPMILQSQANTNSLTINDVRVDDSGKYKCAVSSGNTTVFSKCGALSVVELNVVQRGTSFLRFNWSIPTSCYGRTFTIHFIQSEQSLMTDVTNFNGTYTLDNLSPYTDYSVYILVESTPGSAGRLALESVQSSTVSALTLSGEPMVIPTQLNQPEIIINSGVGITRKVNLPVINDANGPFSHLYIVIIDSNIISTTKRMIINVQDITTEQLIKESMNPSSSYYVAAVVNASQYIPDHTMSYILGAGDYTTDPNGNVFHNRELEQDVSYFFRIFSIDSSPENEISTTTQLQGSDYINASFIDGYAKGRAYIAAQGPLSNTVDDFWRMVWEQNVTTIVMLTRLVEEEKIKCCQYWPSQGSTNYRSIKVTLQKEDQLANYCELNNTYESRVVYQLHFTTWPDHGVPDHPTVMLDFLRIIKRYHDRDATTPILVHCSAGVGQTGTLIAIDSEIGQIKLRNTVNVFECVCKMRYYRNHMVQTSEQYEFIHSALLEYVTCGNTSLLGPLDNLRNKIDELCNNVSARKTKLQMQFEKLCSIT